MACRSVSRGSLWVAVGALVFGAWMCAWGAPIRNIILCIGDGMGVEQVRAARCYAGAGLAFEAFPHQSLVATADASGGITDSAAAATAMSTGVKVYSGVVSLATPGSGGELETLLEFFAKRGKSAGLVTTSYLTDATPAAFGAHAWNRYAQSDIAADYLWQTRPDVLLGGGGGGLAAEAAVAAGYAVATDAASMEALRDAPAGPVIGLFGQGSMPYEADGLGVLPRLPQMVDVALARLSRDPEGFFLMIEGGLIDHACHGNDLARCVPEVLAFDEAVRVVLAWMGGRNDTLLLVTADHETGGLAVLADNGPGALPDVEWSSGWHTGSSVALYGFGVGAEGAASVEDNTQVRGVACAGAVMPAAGVGLWRAAGGQLWAEWAVGSGNVCRVEFSRSLSAPSWQDCGTITAKSERVVFEAPASLASWPSGFFRLITLP